MIDLIKLMEPSLPVVSRGVINQLLHFLGRSGKVETMMKVFGDFTYSLLLFLHELFEQNHDLDHLKAKWKLLVYQAFL